MYIVCLSVPKYYFKNGSDDFDEIYSKCKVTECLVGSSFDATMPTLRNPLATDQTLPATDLKYTDVILRRK